MLSNAMFRLSVSRFVQKIFAIKLSKNTANAKVFGPHFLWEGRLRLFYGSLLGRLTTHYLAKFGRVPFGDLRLRSLARKQNACRICGGWVKTHFQFEAVCGPNSMLF